MSTDTSGITPPFANHVDPPLGVGRVKVDFEGANLRSAVADLAELVEEVVGWMDDELTRIARDGGSSPPDSEDANHLLSRAREVRSLIGITLRGAS